MRRTLSSVSWAQRRHLPLAELPAASEAGLDAAAGAETLFF